MARDSQLTRLDAGNPFAQHGEARGAGAPDALGETLKGPRDRQHSRRHFDAAENRIPRRDDEIAVQGEFETAAERKPADRGDRWNPQRLDRAIGQIHLRDESAEPVDVLAWPFSHFAAQAEVRPFGLDDENSDVAFAGLVHSLPKAVRVALVEPIERRICEYNSPDGVIAFEPNGLHGRSPESGER